MKKLLILGIMGIVGLMLVSCVKQNFNYNSSRYMPVLFDTLSRTDYVTTKKLSAEVTISYAKGALTEEFAKTYKQGTFSKVVVPTAVKMSFFEKLMAAKAAALVPKDPGLDFAMYALHQKYPDVDYFMDVRVLRKGTQKKMLLSGKVFKEGPETITVIATGVDLKTDK